MKRANLCKHELAFATCVEVGVKALGITKIAVSATIAPNENINLLIVLVSRNLVLKHIVQ
jgi:hypothetical protein